MKLSQLIATLATGLLVSTVPAASQAQLSPYSLSTRAFFLTSCLSDSSPDYTNSNEIYLTTRTCLCLLEKFQATYSHEEFIKLFQGVDANQQPQAREAERFAQQHLPGCI